MSNEQKMGNFKTRRGASESAGPDPRDGPTDN